MLLFTALGLPVCSEAGESGAKVSYVGGTIASLKQKTDGVVDTTDDRTLQFRYRKGAIIEVAYESVNLLEYGQKVDRRYAMAIVVSPMFLLSKKRNHYLTIGFSDDEGRQQAMVFQVNKDDVRSVLVSLEARTGRKVQHQDDEARKAGKG